MWRSHQTGRKLISRPIFGQLTWNLLWVHTAIPLTKSYEVSMATMACWAAWPPLPCLQSVFIVIIYVFYFIFFVRFWEIKIRYALIVMLSLSSDCNAFFPANVLVLIKHKERTVLKLYSRKLKLIQSEIFQTRFNNRCYRNWLWWLKVLCTSSCAYATVYLSLRLLLLLFSKTAAARLKHNVYTSMENLKFCNNSIRSYFYFRCEIGSVLLPNTHCKIFSLLVKSVSVSMLTLWI